MVLSGEETRTQIFTTEIELLKQMSYFVLTIPNNNLSIFSAEKLGRAGEKGSSAPMMKVIAQLWCHEVSRSFGDRIICNEGSVLHIFSTLFMSSSAFLLLSLLLTF